MFGFRRTASAIAAVLALVGGLCASAHATTTACGGPITITAGGTYNGCYQSSNNAVPAVTIATTAAVTLSHATINHKGVGVQDTVTGTNVTIRDSTFSQSDPGAVVLHRAVELERPASFIAEHNSLVDGDGIWLGGPSSAAITIRYNLATNIGRYPHPLSPNCCVQFVQLDHIVSPSILIAWNKTANQPGQSDVEDNINFYYSGGTDSTHRSNIHHNLIDGAYPRALNNSGFTGGGINIGDAGAAHNRGHDNTVVSTTNFGVGLSQTDNYSTNDLLVNDGVEQPSDFGQAVTAFQNVSPSGAHATNEKYNWHRFAGDPNQWPCYQASRCSGGVQVSTTEQQARDQWEAARVAAGITVGPRP